MCGRVALTASADEVSEVVHIKKLDDFPPRYNIAPTQPLLAVLHGAAGEREGTLVRWGLVPSWVKDPADFTLLINARAETAITKPSFRNAMRHRRALIPASGFYEWSRPASGKGKGQAYWVRPRDGGIVTFGGLVETWHSKDGSEIDTGCILTSEANAALSHIHNRLPVVIHPDDHERWLDCKTLEPRDVADLMQPVRDDYFEAIPVGDAVNKVANTGPEIQQRVDPTSRVQAPGQGGPKGPAKPAPDDQLDLF